MGLVMGEQVQKDDSRVLVDYRMHVRVKGDLGKPLVLLQCHFLLLCFLGPEEGHGATDLNVSEVQLAVIVVQNYFSFDKICNISLVVKTASIESSACHSKPSSRY